MTRADEGVGSWGSDSRLEEFGQFLRNVAERGGTETVAVTE